MSITYDYVKDDEELIRVYYPNVCTFCFKATGLFPCNNCRKVQYCSKEHQQKDKEFHEGICSFIAKCDLTVGVCDHVSYQEKLRNFKLLKSQLEQKQRAITLLEREMIFLPWVCIDCKTKKNLSFICTQCLSVAYCSEKHEESDRENHLVLCTALLKIRTYYSLGYENGLKINYLKCEYKNVFGRKNNIFPQKREDLLKIIMKQNPEKSDVIKFFNQMVFSDRHFIAATVILALTQIEAIENRFFKWPSTKKLSLMPNSKTKYTGTMVIHVVHACEYELEQIQWNTFALLICDWVQNINHVHIILVGTDLKYRRRPNLESLGSNVTLDIHEVHYRDIQENLDDPEVIIFFNAGYPNVGLLEEPVIDNEVRILFNKCNIPVIITSAFGRLLCAVNESIEKYKDVNIQRFKYGENVYVEQRPYRFWDDSGYQEGSSNKYIGVYKRSK